MRNALALQTTFEDPGAVEHVADDIDSCTLIYADDEREVVDMIEEERCPLSDPHHSDGIHLYLDSENHCCRCGMEAPWIRRDACRGS